MIVFLVTKWDFISIEVIAILSARGLICVAFIILPDQVCFPYNVSLFWISYLLILSFFIKNYWSGDSSLSTNEQTRDWNEMQGNGELEDIEILLSFYDNINRVWLCLSLLHKASSILLVFTVCPHRDPVRVHYISNVWIFWYSQMTSIMIPLKSFTRLLVQQNKFKRV